MEHWQIAMWKSIIAMWISQLANGKMPVDDGRWPKGDSKERLFGEAGRVGAAKAKELPKLKTARAVFKIQIHKFDKV